MDFRTIIAEDPYDAMGRDFQEIFGKWVNETELQTPKDFASLALDLFLKRLDLAKKYNTFFAKQVTDGGDRWKDRFDGVGNDTCYSFATHVVPRTIRFYKWCQLVTEEPNSVRYWDTNFSALPPLPGTFQPQSPMKVWGHRYEPRFTARVGGNFESRRMAYADGLYLIEHPRSRWIKIIRSEAQTFWNIAFDDNNEKYTRCVALASFEWLWFWANPFMRSGALTGDALSLVMQKRIGAHIRPGFYHQDCEALLLPFNGYVTKRTDDMMNGFVQKFPM